MDHCPKMGQYFKRRILEMKVATIIFLIVMQCLKLFL